MLKNSGLSPHILNANTYSAKRIVKSFSDSLNYAKPDYSDETWKTSIPDSNGVFWIRAKFDLSEANTRYLKGLRVEFLASYYLYLNGKKIAENGVVATRSRDEKSGDLLKIFHIPKDLLIKGRNIIALRASNWNGPTKVRLFSLHIGNYKSLIAKPIFFVGSVLLVSFLFVIFIVFRLLRSKRLEAKLHWMLIFIAAVFLIQISLEYSKFIYSYDYDWHFTRLKLILASHFIISITITYFLSNLMKQRKPLIQLLPYFVLTISFFTFSINFDLANILTILLMCLIAFSNFLFLKDRSDLKVLLALASVSSFILVIYYADISIYLSGLFFLALNSFVLEKLFVPDSQKKLTMNSKIMLKKKGSLEAIECSDIAFIKGAKQYSEIILKSGKSELYEKGLDKILSDLPSSFIRIHKSFIVNKEQAVKIEIVGGGKYNLILSDKSSLPIGRSYYKEVKDLIFI